MQKEMILNAVFNSLITEAALNVLGDARDNMVNSLTMNLMNQNGKVTLEESEFFGRIVDKVIMEATSDFIPEEVDVPDEDSQDPIELWDAAGNKYVFQDGQLYDAGEDGEDDGDGDIDPAGQPDIDPAAPADVDPAAADAALDPASADAALDPAAVPGEGDDAALAADAGEGDDAGEEEEEEDEEEMEESTKIAKDLENIEESTLHSNDAVRNIMNKLIR